MSSSSQPSRQGALIATSVMVGVAMLLCVVVVVAHARSRKELDDEPAFVPKPRPPRVDTRAVREVDREFSQAAFEDFVYTLYATAQRARHDPAALRALAPYLSELACAGLSLRTQRVTAAIVGALRLESVVVTEAHSEISVRYTANLAYGKSSTEYVEETWAFRRAAGVLSKAPEELQRLGCPNCAAPLESMNGNACGHCWQSVTNGRFGWQVARRTVHTSERVPPTLGSTVEEEGTSSETIFAEDLDEALSRLRSTDPTVDEHQIAQRVRVIYTALNDAWNSRDLDRVCPYITRHLYDYMGYWLEAYDDQGLRNSLTEAAIENLVMTKVVCDRHYAAITFRVFASGYEASFDKHTGKLATGSFDAKRDYSEYWTLVRGASTRGPARTDPNCPSCAAPLAVGQAGICAHCGAHVARGQFDWVLSKIEQDDVYEG